VIKILTIFEPNDIIKLGNRQFVEHFIHCGHALNRYFCKRRFIVAFEFNSKLSYTIRNGFPAKAVTHLLFFCLFLNTIMNHDSFGLSNCLSIVIDDRASGKTRIPERRGDNCGYPLRGRGRRRWSPRPGTPASWSTRDARRVCR